MKCFQRAYCFILLTCLLRISAFAQTVAYLDEHYNPATSSNYTFKRVIKYLRPIINPNIGIGYNGNFTTRPTPTGLHVCSLTDYYRTGEPALAANVLVLDPTCPANQFSFDGQATWYYRDGIIKQKAVYKSGKIDGVVVTFNEDGTVQKQVEYNNGILLEPNKFAISPNNPFIGIWKYVESTPSPFPNMPPIVKSVLIATFSKDDILEIRGQSGFTNESEKTNWKYIPKTVVTGVLEQYRGDEMLYRGNVRWLSRDQFEYVCTFHPDANRIGERLLWARQ